MKYTVIKPFRSGDAVLAKGDVVDFAPSRRVQDLISARYLLPCDAESIQMNTTVSNEQTIKQQTKKAKAPQSPSAE